MTMGAHIDSEGKFQSDKFPGCPPDKVPVGVGDERAQDLLWELARRYEDVDREFSEDLRSRLKARGFEWIGDLPKPERVEELVEQGRLLDEAALILEQEGWLLARMVHDGNQSSRLRRLSERSRAWQNKVDAFRAKHPGVWREPPDNS